MTPREKCWVRLPSQHEWGYQTRCTKDYGHEGSHARYSSIAFGEQAGLPAWTHTDEWPFDTDDDLDVVYDPTIERAHHCESVMPHRIKNYAPRCDGSEGHDEWHWHWYSGYVRLTWTDLPA